MDHQFERHLRINFTADRSSVRHIPLRHLSNPDEFLISLKFSGNSLLYDSIESRLFDSSNRPPLETSIVITLPELFSHDASRRSIGKGLENWPLLDDERSKLIETALGWSRVTIPLIPADHNMVFMDVRVDVTCDHLFDESMDEMMIIEHSIRDSMDEDCMIPALESSIGNLGRKVVTGREPVGACTVCIEEFSRGCEVVCLPCLHCFHGDCIEKWLRTSHYCPICRFEMPTC